MLYLKYAGLFTLYSVITSLVFIIVDVIMYPSLLQGLIEKKLPFKVIIQDLYKDFTTTQKEDKFHKFANKFLNSIASVGYQFAMLVYMLVLIILYSLAGLLIFNIGFYGLASVFSIFGLTPVSKFFDVFNILFEIYGFVLISFLISHQVSSRYHQYINERFELKARGFSDHIHSFFRVIVFLIPGIIGVLATMTNNAFSNFINWLAKLVNVTDIFRLFMGNVPDVFLVHTKGSLFVMSTIVSLVLLIVFDVNYTKRISSKANKKILKESKQQIKAQEESLAATSEELAKTKQEKELMEEEKRSLENNAQEEVVTLETASEEVTETPTVEEVIEEVQEPEQLVSEEVVSEVESTPEEVSEEKVVEEASEE